MTTPVTSMPTTSVALRRLARTRADAELLFAWRNDPLSRRMSLRPEALAWNDHVAWVERLLDDPDRLQLVAEDGGVPVGAVRFDREGRRVIVSVMVAPVARGRGLAARIVGAGLGEARAAFPDVTAADAVIRPDNTASRRAFARAGFKIVSGADAVAEDGGGGVELWRRGLEGVLALDGPRPLVIAELSANHGGSMTRAVDTIAAAAEAGADAIKLQTYTPDTMTLRSPRAEFRVAHGPWAGRTLWDLYQEAHTPWEWHAELKRAAQAAGLPLFSTPFDASAVDFLEELGVPAYKVASFEITDLELLARIAATGKPVIASTGMATLAEIDQAVRTLRDGWRSGAGAGGGGAAGEAGVPAPPPALALLKCVSAYPAEPRHMNLRTIAHLGAAFGAVPGLSDHTLGWTVAVAAVALGARVIEKHFTLRRADGGPDSHFSLEPAELRGLTAAVRDASAALGDVSYGPTEGDAENTLFRRSLFFSAPVKAGEPLTRANVRAIRPGHGLSPRALPLVLGRKAAADVEAGEPLRWDLIG